MNKTIQKLILCLIQNDTYLQQMLHVVSTYQQLKGIHSVYLNLQNIQWLTELGEVKNYVVKYIGK